MRAETCLPYSEVSSSLIRVRQIDWKGRCPDVDRHLIQSQRNMQILILTDHQTLLYSTRKSAKYIIFSLMVIHG